MRRRCPTKLPLWLALACGQLSCADILDLHEALPNPLSCTSANQCAPGFECSFGVCFKDSCSPGERACQGLTPVRCRSNSTWEPETKPCEAICDRGECVQPRSCQGKTAVSCAGGASCCNAIFIPQDGVEDTINMRYAQTSQDGSAESDVRTVERTLRPITLDRFEVTASRFRQFLSFYDLELPPKPDQGAHPAFPDSGWQSAWSEPGGPLQASAKNLQGDLQAQGQTFTQDVDGELPVRGVDWYTAFAFCIWDGGRLPTEAEWAYAAFGGDDDRLYPWSIDRTAPTDEQARFSDKDEMFDAPLPVGSLPAGQGRFGHDDLAGNLYEWVADSFQDELMLDCTRTNSAGVDAHECLAVDDGARRVLRGGSYADTSSSLRNTTRSWGFADSGLPKLGFRCARDVGPTPTQR